MASGGLRVYLGVAPGVGCTHAMIEEGVRRRARGTDVVVGVLAARHRERAGTLEIVGSGSELDVTALLDRRPTVVLVDDLAESAPDETPRWQQAQRLIAEGIQVVATADITVVASLRDVIARITGQAPPHVIPDHVLTQAQLELRDMSPEALRRRLVHGGLFHAEELDAARAAAFAPATLAALREVAFDWMTGAVRGWAPTNQQAIGESGERLLVALSGGPADQAVLDRGIRLAHRVGGAPITVAQVLAASTGIPGQVTAPEPESLARAAGLAYQQVIGDDPAAALLDLARSLRATQIVIGCPSHGSRWRRGGSVAQRLLAAGTIPVLAVPSAPDAASASPLARPGTALSRSRRWGGFALAATLPVLLTLVLQPFGDQPGLASIALCFMAIEVVVALVGGLGAALIGAVVCSTLLNYFFIPPLHTLNIAEAHNVLTLAVFIVVAVLVGAIVQQAAAQTVRAARAGAESRTLTRIAEDTLLGREALAVLLQQVRTSFGMRAVSLLRGHPGAWSQVAAVGLEPPADPDHADVHVEAGANLVLALSGRQLAAADRAVLATISAQVRGVLERDELAKSAAAAAKLEATERLRDALLVAVGHDLRTPLATARTAVESLRNKALSLSADQQAELLGVASEALGRLTRLVADLLDLSRLRAGALTVRHEQVWVDDVVAPALDELGPAASEITVKAPDDLPPAWADAALLTRSIVNLVANSLRHAPGSPVTITCSATGERVEIRVIDHGPGVQPADAERMFSPFQRLGDTDRGGLGLGLALSRGLIEAMAGSLTAEETPRGGLTMVITLPVAREEAPADGETGEDDQLMTDGDDDRRG